MEERMFSFKFDGSLSITCDIVNKPKSWDIKMLQGN